MTLKLTILGCGTSGGVPRVGNIWGACDPSNLKNRRRRCSVLVQKEGGEGTTNVLVDTPPDLREQLLDVGVGWLDGVLYTHDHADHTHGIDDLRMVSYNGRRRVAAYYDELTGKQLRQRFAYCFKMSANRAWRIVENSRSGRRHLGLAVPPATRLRRDARFSLRRHRLFSRHQRPARGISQIPREPRCVDHRCAPLCAASEPFQRRGGACLDQANQTEARGAHPHACRS